MNSIHFYHLVELALAEDLGAAGDITSAACIPADATSRAAIVAKSPGVICGVEIAEHVFKRVNPMVEVSREVSDGVQAARGETILRVEGPSRALLTAERTALNFMTHLSGIATTTHQMMKLIEGTSAKLLDTRKTTPGYRALEKHAVHCGGGTNHRFGLHDAVMIKDNHIVAAGGIAKAIRAAKAHVNHLVKIEVEVKSLEEFEEAKQEKPDVIMLDNMSPDMIRECIAANQSGITLEASGGINATNLRAYAETGVDYISVGWITHSAPNLDLSLEFFS